MTRIALAISTCWLLAATGCSYEREHDPEDVAARPGAPTATIATVTAVSGACLGRRSPVVAARPVAIDGRALSIGDEVIVTGTVLALGAAPSIPDARPSGPGVYLQAARIDVVRAR